MIGSAAGVESVCMSAATDLSTSKRSDFVAEQLMLFDPEILELKVLDMNVPGVVSYLEVEEAEWLGGEPEALGSLDDDTRACIGDLLVYSGEQLLLDESF